MLVALMATTLVALALVTSPAIAATAKALEPNVTIKGDCAVPPIWVSLDSWRVLEIRSVPGAQTPETYAERAQVRLKQVAQDDTFQPRQFTVRDEPPYSFIGIERNGKFVRELAVDDRAGACFGLTRQALAEKYRADLHQAVERYRTRNTPHAWLVGTALALLVLGVFVLLLRLELGINRRIKDQIARRRRFPLLTGFGLLSQLVAVEQARRLVQLLRQLTHWTLLLLISYLLIPLLLGFFPPTEGLAEGLRSQIIAVVVGAFSALAGVIPDLLKVAVILTLTVFVIRGSNACFRAVEEDRLQIPGFYPEWGQPTARLAAILLGLMGLMLAYPYIPGSNSKAFQGAGLLLGVLAALGSSAIATNIISGLMLIYTRAFRIDDRVEINGTVGIVQERALLVTRVRTPRNELVSIPNATVIGASIVNFSFSRREIQQPVAIATTVTIGYDVPWRQVHELMLNAAAETIGLSLDLPPFVLQTSLNDFHISYELNAFVADVDTYRRTLSDLLGAIQDQFAAAGVEILSPGYHAMRNGNRSTLPPWPAAPFGEQPPG